MDTQADFAFPTGPDGYVRNLLRHARARAHFYRLFGNSPLDGIFAAGQISEGIHVAEYHLRTDPLLLRAVENEARFLLGDYLRRRS